MSRLATHADLDAAISKMVSSVALEVGVKLGAALEKRAAHASQKPMTFKGNVALATFSAGEATEIADPAHLALIGEYANNAEVLSAAGLSLESYVCDRLADEHGIGHPGSTLGYKARMSADFKSALAKQSEKFEARFPVKRLNPKNPLSA